MKKLTLLVMLCALALSPGCKLIDWIRDNVPLPPPPVPEHPIEGSIAAMLREGARPPRGRPMNYLGGSYSDDQFKELVGWARSVGCNTIYLYLSNAGDGPMVSFYVGGVFAGQVDEDAVDRMLDRVDYAMREGLTPWFWCFADDSSVISRAPLEKQFKFMDDCVDIFGRRAGAWVIALEADEHMDYDRVAALAQHLASLTTKPIGLHLLTHRYEWSVRIPEVSFHCHQYEFGSSAATVLNETRHVISRLRPDQLMVACEFTKDTGSPEAYALRAAAVEGGADGVGVE